MIWTNISKTRTFSFFSIGSYRLPSFIILVFAGAERRAPIKNNIIGDIPERPVLLTNQDIVCCFNKKIQSYQKKTYRSDDDGDKQRPLDIVIYDNQVITYQIWIPHVFSG